MPEKYVKDRSHNRYPAYCCDDIDERVGALEEAVAALVAGTIPDGSVTLAKLADDARAWSREINRGRLVAEWIGTYDEYKDHLVANGGEPLANVKYTITDRQSFAKMATGTIYPIGSFVTAVELLNGEDPSVFPQIGKTQANMYLPKTESPITGDTIVGTFAYRTYAEAADSYVDGGPATGVITLFGLWRMCGISGMRSDPSSTNRLYTYEIWQKLKEHEG